MSIALGRGVSRDRASRFVSEATNRGVSASTLRLWSAQLPGLIREGEPFSNDTWGADIFDLVAACTIAALRAVGCTTVALRRSLLHPTRGLERLRERIEKDRTRWAVAVTDQGCFPIDEEGLEAETLDDIQRNGVPKFLQIVTIGEYARDARRLIDNS